ncbi:hypothetical protein FEM48_Zijuj03G0106600 [Ziziphus jujuba var. spinosa]|uniref:Chromo domain-containing protein n=1 Tax=Ziziphus jujuba var. spinosa TaxID=714518 RepID=A0A978VPU1_ZIZJJ|nr:hypothetical protein FEM48_Zijuj03G0106600 [Ziziphus jujuba var. spinosa]
MWLKTQINLSKTLRSTYTEILGKWSIGDLAFCINYFIWRQVSVTIKKDLPTFCSTGAIFFIANASTACVVSSRRAWSRAMLRKIQSQSTCVKVRRRTKFRMKKKDLDEKEARNLKAMEFRKPVPSGEAMEIYKLLNETIHCCKCLTTQVKGFQLYKRMEEQYRNSDVKPYYPNNKDSLCNNPAKANLNIKLLKMVKEVKKILADRVRYVHQRPIQEYLVKWKGLGDEEIT